MGLIFENAECDSKANRQGLTIDGETYFPSRPFPATWTFMKFTLVGLPNVRNPSISLVDPIRSMFAPIGKVGGICLHYEEGDSLSLFQNRAQVYVFGINKDIVQEIERNPDIKPSMELEYQGLKFPVCVGWKGSAPFCNYCKQSDHTIGKCPKRLSLRCQACGDKGHVSSGCLRYGRKHKRIDANQAHHAENPAIRETETETASTHSPEDSTPPPNDDEQSTSDSETASADPQTSSISDTDTVMQELSTTTVTLNNITPKATPSKASSKSGGDRATDNSNSRPWTRSQTRARDASDPESSSPIRGTGGSRGGNKKKKT
jgi:hypothetical protein